MTQLIEYEIRPLADVVRDHICLALQKRSGNILQTSKSLGISRMSLYRRLEKYKIDRYGCNKTE